MFSILPTAAAAAGGGGGRLELAALLGGARGEGVVEVGRGAHVPVARLPVLRVPAPARACVYYH